MIIQIVVNDIPQFLSDKKDKKIQEIILLIFTIDSYCQKATVQNIQNKMSQK